VRLDNTWSQSWNEFVGNNQNRADQRENVQNILEIFQNHRFFDHVKKFSIVIRKRHPSLPLRSVDGLSIIQALK